MPTSTPPPYARCHAHPVRAGWECTVCGRALCQRCAARRPTGPGELVVCKVCGELAQPILMRRPPLSVPDLLLDVLLYPFRPEGRATLVLTAFLLAIFKLAWLPGLFFATGLTAIYLFDIIRTSWKGSKSLPDPSEFTHSIDVTAAAIRGTVAAALAILPYWTYVWLRYHPQGYQEGPFKDSSWMYTVLELGQHLTDPIGLALIALGLVWCPIGIMLTAVGFKMSGVVNPVSGWRMIRAMGPRFYVGVAVFWALVAVWFRLGMWADQLGTRVLYVIPLAALEPIRFVFAIMAGRTLGLMLYVHGAELGYGSEEFYLIPVLGKAQPLDVVPTRVSEPRAAVEHDPIPLDPVSAPATAQAPPTWQPTDAAAGISLGTIEPVAPASKPTTKPAPPTEDLMPEDEFLALANRTNTRGPKS